MRIELSVVTVVALLAGCAASGTDQPDARQLANSYRSLRLMTADPVFVEPALALLCRGATPDDIQRAREAAGPHALTTVRIYMNDAAADTFGQPGLKYPVGSIIVKEKAATGVASDRGHDGIGGMIKRAPGYDPANSDWEYFYFENAANIERGKIVSCIACHRGAADRDFVFGDWARDSARNLNGR